MEEISKGKTSITQQFYSPSESRKILKQKSKGENSVDRSKFQGGRTQRTKAIDKFHNQKDHSIKESNNAQLKAMLSGSKSKNRRDIDDSLNNDTFESSKGYILKSEVKDARKNKYKVESYRTKTLSQLKNEIDDVNVTNPTDSARNSDHSSKYIKNPVKEFMEAASNGVRDKLDRLLKSGKIKDVN